MFWPSAKRRRSKYNAQAETTGGKRFASKKEAARFRQLYVMQLAGQIEDLRTQVWYPLIVNGIRVCDYVADFTYRERDTELRVVEDVKGMPTPVYILKKKLMMACYGIELKEV
jgi:hypothetical protein